MRHPWLRCRICGHNAKSAGGLHKHVRVHGLKALIYYAKHRGALKLRIRDQVEEVRRVPRLDEPCWEWQGLVTPRSGYGRLRVAGLDSGAAHRISYWAHRGHFPHDLLLHQCDNPPCVNPAHLTDGSHTQNMEDRQERHRQIHGSAHHKAKLTEAQVFEIRCLREITGQTQAALAEQYGVSESAVCHILAGRTFAHVPFPKDVPNDPDHIPF